MGETRQVRRARERANDYWVRDKLGRLTPVGHRSCRLVNASDREHVSRSAIAARAVRERLSPRPEPRFAHGSKHAWQRKAAAAEAMRKLLAGAPS